MPDPQPLRPARLLEGNVRTHRYRAVVGVHVALVREGRILLGLRQGTPWMNGRWHLMPAGHLEDGKDLLSATVREAAEELDVRVDPAAVELAHVLHHAAEPGAGDCSDRVHLPGPVLDRRTGQRRTAPLRPARMVSAGPPPAADGARRDRPRAGRAVVLDVRGLGVNAAESRSMRRAVLSWCTARQAWPTDQLRTHSW